METVNQVQTENTNTEETAKTFTQAEVDKIVEGRLQRERAKSFTWGGKWSMIKHEIHR